MPTLKILQVDLRTLAETLMVEAPQVDQLATRATLAQVSA